MQNFTKPFVNLSTANAELITRFSQLQEMVDLVNTSVQKYLELSSWHRRLSEVRPRPRPRPT